MPNYVLHTKDTAPSASLETLQSVQKAYGFLPNLIATFAESPSITKAYVALGEIFEDTEFSAAEKQVILLTVSRYHECAYCMAAHSSLAQMKHVPQHVIDAVRDDRPIDDARLEALHSFTRKLVDQRGWVTDEDTETFINAGYSKANVLDVILGIGFKTLSNYTNHIATTPIDDAFAQNTWALD